MRNRLLKRNLLIYKRLPRPRADYPIPPSLPEIQAINLNNSEQLKTLDGTILFIGINMESFVTMFASTF